MNTTPYQILDIATGADWEEIKKTWKKQALKWHPDKPTPQGFTKKQQEEKFKNINNAFEQIRKEKTKNDEEEISEFNFNPQDVIDELFFEAGFENFENWNKHFSQFIKETCIENIKLQMSGMEEEINTDTKFWSNFGRDWEEKINRMNLEEINPFYQKMSGALQNISDEKFAKEQEKVDEFNENHDKGMKFIKSYLKSKSLNNAEFNSWMKSHTSPPMTEQNWYEKSINWGHKDSIDTYVYMINSCASEKQRSLDEQRVIWKEKQGGDSYLRAITIEEINNYWGSEQTINGKKLEQLIGSDWRAQINDSKGSSINEKKINFKKMIDQVKQKTDQNSSPQEYLPYILGGIGIFAFIILITVLATNNKRRR
jgi:curved DNA-binding protein CbpA